jgi:Transcriptional regulator, AbiEi antitoxin
VVVNIYRGLIAMAEPATKMEATLGLLREHGTLRPRDLARRSIPPDYLDRLYRLGRVDRVARGLYAWSDAEVSEHHDLA